MPEDATLEVRVQPQDEPRGGLSFWNGFWLGAYVALVYNILRNPGSCACCLVVVGLLVLALGVVVVAVFAEIWPIVLLAIAVAVGLRLLYLWRRKPPPGPTRPRLP